jgi:hypothetical protein
VGDRDICPGTSPLCGDFRSARRSPRSDDPTGARWVGIHWLTMYLLMMLGLPGNQAQGTKSATPVTFDPLRRVLLKAHAAGGHGH